MGGGLPYESIHICHSQRFRASEESDTATLMHKRSSSTARNLIPLAISLNRESTSASIPSRVLSSRTDVRDLSFKNEILNQVQDDRLEKHGFLINTFGNDTVRSLKTPLRKRGLGGIYLSPPPFQRGRAWVGVYLSQSLRGCKAPAAISPITRPSALPMMKAPPRLHHPVRVRLTQSP